MSQIFAARRTLSLLTSGINVKICTATPSTTTKVVNVNIDFIVNCYFYLV